MLLRGGREEHSAPPGPAPAWPRCRDPSKGLVLGQGKVGGEEGSGAVKFCQESLGWGQAKVGSEGFRLQGFGLEGTGCPAGSSQSHRPHPVPEQTRSCHERQQPAGACTHETLHKTCLPPVQPEQMRPRQEQEPGA